MPFASAALTIARASGCSLERTGTSNDQNRYGRDQRMGKARLRAKEHPASERQDRRRNYGRDEIRSDAVGEARDRCAATLRFADESYDLRERRFATHSLRFHDEASARIERAAGDAVARALLDGHRFARHHGFIP